MTNNFNYRKLDKKHNFLNKMKQRYKNYLDLQIFYYLFPLL